MADDFQRFAYPDHNQLAACASSSRRVAQLAVSHPLLFFAIATGYGPLEQRTEAVRLCELGRSLKEVSAAAGIPFSLRRVQPEALRRPLTRARISELSARVIAQRCARRPVSAQQTVATAFYGARIGGEDFGLWLSRPENVIQVAGHDLERLRGIAMYAWFTSRPDQPLSALTNRPWSNNFSWRSALQETRLWLNYLKFFIYFHDAPLEPAWAEGATVDGYEIVPLTTFEQLVDEVVDMNNCLISYADRLLDDSCRLFGVRCGRVKIGTAEVIQAGNGDLMVMQFCGPSNSRVPILARAAVEKWAASRSPTAVARASGQRRVNCERRLDKALAPYQRACRVGPDFWRRPISLTVVDFELRSLNMPSLVRVALRDTARLPH